MSTQRIQPDVEARKWLERRRETQKRYYASHREELRQKRQAKNPNIKPRKALDEAAAIEKCKELREKQRAYHENVRKRAGLYDVLAIKLAELGSCGMLESRILKILEDATNERLVGMKEGVKT